MTKQLLVFSSSSLSAQLWLCFLSSTRSLFWSAESHSKFSACILSCAVIVSAVQQWYNYCIGIAFYTEILLIRPLCSIYFCIPYNYHCSLFSLQRHEWRHDAYSCRKWVQFPFSILNQITQRKLWIAVTCSSLIFFWI